jgi:predicted PurR-regulated permease PerM
MPDSEEQTRHVTFSVQGWVAGAAVVALAVLIWNIVERSLSAFVLLFTAILMAEALRSPIDMLAKRIPRGIAILIVFGAAIGIAAIITVVLFQPLGSQVANLIGALPAFVHSLQLKLVETQRFIRADATMSSLAGTLANAAGGLFTNLAQYLIRGPALVGTLIGSGLLIILLAVGWVTASDGLLAFVLSLLPAKARANWRDALEDVGRKLGAYTQGVVINGAVVGVVCGVAFALAQTPFALLLGFIVAIFQAIPMVGAVISGIIIVIVTLATAGWSKALIVFAIFAVVQMIDQNALSPIIFGKRVEISFLLTVFAAVVGGTLLGIAGAFLGVPAAAAVQTILVKIVAPAIRARNEVAGRA